MRLPVLIALLAGLWATTTATTAQAETFNTCAGFITSLPATISTQGTWCLSKDLATTITSGNAIEVAVNNVTIDCNNFKLGGLAAGDGSLTLGIHANGRQNITVRNCTIRGFYAGILFEGGAGGGHLVEDNRLDNNLQTGIHVQGDGSTIRGNFVNGTGGATGQTYAHGIVAFDTVDVLDNTVSDVNSLVDPYGMTIGWNSGGVVAGNRIRGLWSTTGYYHRMGILAKNNNDTVMRDNVVVNYGNTTQAVGIQCEGTGTGTHIRDNRIHAFGAAQSGCIDDGGN